VGATPWLTFSAVPCRAASLYIITLEYSCSFKLYAPVCIAPLPRGQLVIASICSFIPRSIPLSAYSTAVFHCSTPLLYATFVSHRLVPWTIPLLCCTAPNHYIITLVLRPSFSFALLTSGQRMSAADCCTGCATRTSVRRYHRPSDSVAA